ncbi:MAG: tetratricopeptide repeat protein [Burkholderiaceae bacterium]|nr:tetratricopeptide repeat protein [Burkholderiaceae bacterium]
MPVNRRYPNALISRILPRGCVMLSLCFALQGQSIAQSTSDSACGNPFRNHFGPWDYRVASQHDKQLVETAHFTPGIESLTRPVNSTLHNIAGDISYTLAVFPNHHRALISMVRLGERHKSDQPPSSTYTIDCYFRRATTFVPDDTVVRALYALYLAKKGQQAAAVQQLKTAEGFAKDNPLSNYNLGLVYFEIGEFESALVQAHKAIALGYGRTELADKLKAANKWAEPGG